MPNSIDSSHLSAWSLILQAGPVVKLVLLLLMGASVLCWAIVIQKWKLFQLHLASNQNFIDQFWKAESLESIHQNLSQFGTCSAAQVFDAGYREFKKSAQPDSTTLERALDRAHSHEIEQLESRLEWLASTASSAPFIGLFGTVWGIMSSFQSIGASGSANLAVVAPGISEALIATAIGLAAAIPAAIFFNVLNSKLKRISHDLDSFSKDFLNLIDRSLKQAANKTSSGA